MTMTTDPSCFDSALADAIDGTGLRAWLVLGVDAA